MFERNCGGYHQFTLRHSSSLTLNSLPTAWLVLKLWKDWVSYYFGSFLSSPLPLTHDAGFSIVSLATIFNNLSLFQTHTHTHTHTHTEPAGWGPPRSLILLAVWWRVRPHLRTNERKDGTERAQCSGFEPLSLSRYPEAWTGTRRLFRLPDAQPRCSEGSLGGTAEAHSATCVGTNRCTLGHVHTELLSDSLMSSSVTILTAVSYMCTCLLKKNKNRPFRGST